MNKPIRVLLADDHDVVREGWKRIIETADDIQVVGESDSVLDTKRKVLELAPDILLMDLKWHGDTSAGWASIGEIKKSAAGVRIIAITVYENLIENARNAGADVAVQKGVSKDELLNFIRQLGVREAGLRPPPGETLLDDLTEAERKVLSLLVEGKSNKDIAASLGVSANTVRNQVASIMRKLAADNRTQIVILAREFGFYD